MKTYNSKKPWPYWVSYLVGTFSMLSRVDVSQYGWKGILFGLLTVPVAWVLIHAVFRKVTNKPVKPEMFWKDDIKAYYKRLNKKQKK